MTNATIRFEEKVNALADELSEDLGMQYHDTWLTNVASFDYAYGETPVIDVYSSHYLECDKMTEAQFDTIDAAIDAIGQTTHKGFKLEAMVSDSSGYEFWALDGDPLPIILSAEITDVNAIDRNELCEAFVTLADKIHKIITGDAS